MTKEEFIEKIKELGFKNVEMEIDAGDTDNVYFKEYNDNLKITCRCFFSSVMLCFDADNRPLFFTADKAYSFVLFLIKKIENGLNN